MSLVAYGSSDESDSEDSPKTFETGGKSSGLLAGLPAPKKPASEPEGLKRIGPSMGLNLPPPKRDISQKSGSPQRPPSFMSDMDSEKNLDPKRSHDTATGDQPPVSSGLLLNLPKPKKRTEPVKITIPELQKGDSDSEEDEPVSKKALSQASGGLSSLLPQPRNLVVKETQRVLVPHALTKRPQEPRAPARPAAPLSQGASASPSAIKAAAKSAALQLARQIAQDDEGSDEELAPENYFSLSDSSQPAPVVPAPEPPSSSSSSPSSSVAAATLPPPPGTEPPFQSDAPLEFSSAPQNFPGSSGAWEGQQQEAAAFYPRYPESSGQDTEQQQFPQDYYSGGYYQDPEPEATEVEGPGSSSLFDDEAFRRLQGKRNRGKEEVKFLEIKGDDQLSGSQQWMTKNMTEEKEQRKSFSKKKGEQPTGQQRRKHQITYLIHQAKERELELKNSWAENKLTRRQTQAKYGF
ncbi:proline-rich protein PRCC [Conger conger]|uniref:proline-rich protein PRCC n=1 Tax=Conger conger TaxID=82655 RepID=UPI002A5A298F|nr:proline-rich protein PRCC [Conger conger]